MTTWQDNSDEFSRLNRQGKNVRLALLVACSVEKGKPGPKKIDPIGSISAKVDAKTFARRALGVAKSDRVLRHLAAWDVFAKEVGLPLASALTPNDASTLDISQEQVAAFKRVRITAKPKQPESRPEPIPEPIFSTTERPPDTPPRPRQPKVNIDDPEWRAGRISSALGAAAYHLREAARLLALGGVSRLDLRTGLPVAMPEIVQLVEYLTSPDGLSGEIEQFLERSP